MKYGLFFLLVVAILGALPLLRSRPSGDRAGAAQSLTTSPPATLPAAPALRVGHVPSPLLGPLYLAATPGAPLELISFPTTGAVGYALLAGELQAGWVEPAKADRLLSATGSKLRVAGVLQFPYGASLVLRKDLSLRLGDLKGHRIAAADSHCHLLHQFQTDAKRLGLDPASLNITYLPFESMLPALEAGQVDAIIAKSSHSVRANQLGHKTLYQNWHVETDDECCPPIIAQIEYYLLVGQVSSAQVEQLLTQLVAVNEVAPASSRAVVAKYTHTTPEYLADLPTPTFARLDAPLQQRLGAHAWSPAP